MLCVKPFRNAVFRHFRRQNACGETSIRFVEFSTTSCLLKYANVKFHREHTLFVCFPSKTKISKLTGRKGPVVQMTDFVGQALYSNRTPIVRTLFCPAEQQLHARASVFVPPLDSSVDNDIFPFMPQPVTSSLLESLRHR